MIFLEKKPEGCGLELKHMCKGKQLLMKGFDGSFRNNFWGNIVLEIRDSTMEELRLEDVFHASET